MGDDKKKPLCRSVCVLYSFEKGINKWLFPTSLIALEGEGTKRKLL